MKALKLYKKILPAAIAGMAMLFVLSGTAFPQTPQEYFVGGANFYINGENEKALSFVDSGLTKYPEDKKLQALKKAIEEDKKDKDQNQNQDKENQQDQKKEQDKNSEQQKQQDKNQEQQQQQQQKEGSISKEDAQRLLDALANDEKNVQEKVKETKAAKAKVRTLINW